MGPFTPSVIKLEAAAGRHPTASFSSFSSSLRAALPPAGPPQHFVFRSGPPPLRRFRLCVWLPRPSNQSDTTRRRSAAPARILLPPRSGGGSGAEMLSLLLLLFLLLFFLQPPTSEAERLLLLTRTSKTDPVGSNPEPRSWLLFDAAPSDKNFLFFLFFFLRSIKRAKHTHAPIHSHSMNYFLAFICSLDNLPLHNLD